MDIDARLVAIRDDVVLEIRRLQSYLSQLNDMIGEDSNREQEEGQDLIPLNATQSIDAVIEILEDTDLLTQSEIWKSFRMRGYTCLGKRPSATLSARIHNYIGTPGAKIQIASRSPNRYALCDPQEEPFPEEVGESVETGFQPPFPPPGFKPSSEE